MIKLTSLIEELGLDFLLMQDHYVMIASMYHRSEQVVRAASANINLTEFQSFQTGRRKGYFRGQYHAFISPVRADKEEFFHLVLISKKIGESCFITSPEREADDFYQMLMRNYDLPLMKEWAPKILREERESRYISQTYDTVLIYGSNPSSKNPMIGNIPLKRAIVYDISLLSEDRLKTGIQNLFKRGEISITSTFQNPMDEQMTMSDYFNIYGHTLVENLEKKITPLRGLEPVPDTMVLNTMRLFPQQGAIVNGAITLLDRKSNYVIMAEGMGVGKVRRCGVRYDCDWNVA